MTATEFGQIYEAGTFSYASDDSEQSAVRVSAGRYAVRVGPEAAKHSNVQVSALDHESVCNVESWGGGSVVVRCWRDGRPHDARFVVVAVHSPIVWPKIRFPDPPNPLPPSDFHDTP